MKVLVASGNPHKLQEIQAILAVADIETVGLDALPCGPIEAPDETADTFAGNAIDKARYYARQSGMPAIADDSGLEVDALGGDPGVKSARWMGSETPYSVKNARLLELLDALPVDRRTARFVCVVALAWPDGRVLHARGVHEGRIHDQICGEGGFGYDPVFYSLEAGTTFGALSAEQKNRFSHRARALQGLLAVLASHASS